MTAPRARLRAPALHRRERRARLAAQAALASALSFFAPAPAAAAGSTWVMLQRGPAAGPFSEEVVQRARGELTADGFDVEIVEGPLPIDRVAEVTRAGRVHGASIAAGVFIEGDEASIDLVLVDERARRTLERRLDAESREAGRMAPGGESGADAPATVLARRTVDLLRSGLVAFLVEALKAEPESPGPVKLGADGAPPVTKPPRWAVEAGLAVITSFQGVGPALLPIARIRYAVSPAVGARITGAWLGTQPRVSTTAGSAMVEQGVALLEGTARPWSKGWLRPAFSAGLGSYYVAAEGSGYGARRGWTFTVAADVGAAARARLDSQLELVFEVHALVALPGVGIRFLGEDVAHVGRPSVMATWTVAGWF